MKEIKRRQKEYHARLKEEMRERRATIDARQKERTEEISRLAFRQLSADRRKEYNDTLAAHRAERSELKQDQAAGARRHDLLSGPTPATPAANQNAARAEELSGRTDKAKTEVARFKAATPLQASTEITAQPVQRAAVEVTKTPARAPQEQTARDPRTQSRADPPKDLARDAQKAADLARRRAAVDEWQKEHKSADTQRERAAGREVTDQRASTKQPEQTERRTKESDLARRRAAVDELLGERKADRDRGGGRGGRDR